ncbi:hypothetical protein J1D01_15925 [Seonamhaeicola sp. NFXS20]|uniref:hypothetical protein n=1 Tax=Seonamhaeicola sp. NFXS20 TaxID=2816959 RepID=UPI003B8E20FF
MTLINKYVKYVPYLYFISITIYWFTKINKTEGLTAYPILLFGIPFLWQIIKPNNKLNFILGITFVCISSYLILVYLSGIFSFVFNNHNTLSAIIYTGLFVLVNFFMATWIIRNSLKTAF